MWSCFLLCWEEGAAGCWLLDREHAAASTRIHNRAASIDCVLVLGGDLSSADSTQSMETGILTLPADNSLSSATLTGIALSSTIIQPSPKSSSASSTILTLSITICSVSSILDANCLLLLYSDVSSIILVTIAFNLLFLVLTAVQEHRESLFFSSVFSRLTASYCCWITLQSRFVAVSSWLALPSFTSMLSIWSFLRSRAVWAATRFFSFLWTKRQH